MTVFVGTAGWTVPAAGQEHFPAEGSALARYAAVFQGVEINSSFHRPHRRSTWERWAASVPEGFRFSVKLPKTITHRQRLADCRDLLEAFLEESGGLGRKLAVYLVQLPPSFAFDAGLAEHFFRQLGEAVFPAAAVACEPRHPSWFEPEADALLERCRVARVAADPARLPAAAAPGGWRGLDYWRLHGSPVMYRSAYDPFRLEDYARHIRAARSLGRNVWCMFDNTASSAATGDALALMQRL